MKDVGCGLDAASQRYFVGSRDIPAEDVRGNRHVRKYLRASGMLLITYVESKSRRPSTERSSYT